MQLDAHVVNYADDIVIVLSPGNARKRWADVCVLKRLGGGKYLPRRIRPAARASRVEFLALQVTVAFR